MSAGSMRVAADNALLISAKRPYMRLSRRIWAVVWMLGCGFSVGVIWTLCVAARAGAL